MPTRSPTLPVLRVRAYSVSDRLSRAAGWRHLAHSVLARVFDRAAFEQLGDTDPIVAAHAAVGLMRRALFLV